MGLSRTMSQINGDFCRKPQIFLTSCIPRPAEGVSLGIGCRHSGTKNQNNDATGARKKFDGIFDHLDTIHERDRQTDDTRRQRRVVKTVKQNTKSYTLFDVV